METPTSTSLSSSTFNGIFTTNIHHNFISTSRVNHTYPPKIKHDILLDRLTHCPERRSRFLQSRPSCARSSPGVVRLDRLDLRLRSLDDAALTQWSEPRGPDCAARHRPSAPAGPGESCEMKTASLIRSGCVPVGFPHCHSPCHSSSRGIVHDAGAVDHQTQLTTLSAQLLDPFPEDCQLINIELNNKTAMNPNDFYQVMPNYCWSMQNGNCRAFLVSNIPLLSDPYTSNNPPQCKYRCQV